MLLSTSLAVLLYEVKMNANYLLNKVLLFALVFLMQSVVMANSFVVDFEKAFTQYDEFKELNQIFVKKEEQLRDEVQKAQATIEAKVANFTKVSAKLSEKERKAQETALNNEYNLFQQKIMERKSNIDKERSEVLAELQKKSQFLLANIAKNKKAPYVLHSGAIAYIADKSAVTDLTQEMVTAYNKTYPVKKEPKKANAKK